jgi:F-type H+-transporting ATPase subunit delta
MSAKNFMSPYVQAFSALSVSDADFAKGVEDFRAIFGAMESDHLLKDFMCSPAVQKHVREELLRKNLSALGIQELTVRVIVMMIRKNAISHLGQFVALLQEHADERLNILRGTVQTAVDLNESACEIIKNLLADLTGKNTEIKFVVDPQLIGGIRVKMRDLDMDATILRRLENAKTMMINKRA